MRQVGSPPIPSLATFSVAGPSTQSSPSLPAVSEFFSASCVPVNNPKNYPSSLCALCVGDEQGRNKCVGNSQERYYGYSGAFRYPVGRGGGLRAGHRGGTLRLTSALASCVAGAWLRMQGTSLLSSTRLSLTTRMVCGGVVSTAGSDSGRAVPHLQHNPGPGCCWNCGLSGSQGRLSPESCAPWGSQGPQGLNGGGQTPGLIPTCTGRISVFTGLESKSPFHQHDRNSISVILERPFQGYLCGTKVRG